MGNYSFFAERPVEEYHKSDTGLIVATILLWGLGMVTLYVCSSNYAMRIFSDRLYFVERQAVSSAVGLAGLLLFASLRMDVIKKGLPAFAVVTLVLCVLVFVPGIGVNRNGANRWIRIPLLGTFQPSEAVKLVLVLFLANFFDRQARDQIGEDQSNMPAIVGLIVFIFIVFIQKDFSTGAFLFVVALAMFFVSGAKLSWLIPFATLGIPASFIMIALEPYRLERLEGFFHPDMFMHNSNYQAFAAKRAISAGGFWGEGFGSGLTKINSIPEVQADYIFAGWVEAMGYIGVAAYFLLLTFFAYRAYMVAVTSRNRFAALGTFGCATMIVLQSLMNTGVVCGLLPSTGIPLPFFSSGGSSMIITLCMCGFMINASRCDDDEIDSNRVSIEESTGNRGVEIV